MLVSQTPAGRNDQNYVGGVLLNSKTPSAILPFQTKFPCICLSNKRIPVQLHSNNFPLLHAYSDCCRGLNFCTSALGFMNNHATKPDKPDISVTKSVLQRPVDIHRISTHPKDIERTIQPQELLWIF